MDNDDDDDDAIYDVAWQWYVSMAKHWLEIIIL